MKIFSEGHLYRIQKKESDYKLLQMICNAVFANLNFQLPGNFNSGILVVDGKVTINGKAVPENHYVQLKNEAGDIHVESQTKSILLVLSGEPLNEPYVSYGPFVMNTKAEILQAVQDYHNGTFAKY